MSFKSTLTAAALAGSLFLLAGPALSAEPAAVPEAGQPKAAAQPAAPAAKKDAAGAATAAADCAKLTDVKAKDECMKKAQAAPAGASSTTTGSTSKQ